MHRNIEEITKQVIGLPNSERLKLAKTLLILDTQTSENNIEAQWQEEITNRVSAVENGNAVGIDFEDSIKNIRNRLPQ